MEFDVKTAMTIRLPDELPEYPKFVEGLRRAPKRESHLSQHDRETALKNALRYIPKQHHAQMAEEFMQELEERFRF